MKYRKLRDGFRQSIIKISVIFLNKQLTESCSQVLKYCQRNHEVKI